MKFSCDKNILCEAINNVFPAVSSKTTLVALEGILMKCRGGELSLTGYNLELGITKTVAVTGGGDGEVIVNAVLLSNIINKMPGGVVNLTTDEKLLTTIECSDVTFTILGLDPAEYPDMPILTGDREFELPHFLLKNMIAQTLFAIAQTDQNPVHTGSLFDIAGGSLNVVSVDGYRLALRSEKINVEGDFRFVVPGKTLAEIVKLLSRLVLDDEEEKIRIVVSSKHISFCVSGYIVISRLLEGEFLDYRNAIPKETATRVTVETRQFLDSINRASIIINERAKSPVRCTFTSDSIKIFCETALGKINDSIPAAMEGPEVKIGFNNKYMADALKASECEKIVVQINGPISPMKIVPEGDDSFLFLVLPVRLKA